MLYPFNSYFAPEITKLIKSRANNNIAVSSLLAWMRVSSSSGLVLESIPATDSFDLRYGDMTKSGRVGTDFAGNANFVEGDTAFRPSPVIESMGVSFGERGITRKAEFSIKCFTIKQAEEVCTFFLEPGYTVLVEYGWNKSESYSEKINLSPCEIAKFNGYDYLKQKQKNSGYTYDGFLGYITNGGFTTDTGETYVIKVELTSIGEVAAYLQQHRSGGKTTNSEGKPNTKNDGGERFDSRVIESTSISDVGKSLFMQMYNRLPMAKKTENVKQLMKSVDSNNIPFTSEANFINMDDEIRNDLIGELQDTAVNLAQQEGGGENATPTPEAAVPSGVPLVSESSYIRLELAFEILNKVAYETKSVASSCGEDTPTFPLAIEYRDTICRAHPYMFSIDGSKLIIPNRQTPDFGMASVLSATTIQEVGPILGDKGSPIAVINLEQKDTAGKVFRFPQLEQLSNPALFPIDVAPFDALIGQWGYLKDLYINFEFFIEVLQKSNYVAKDIYYELLNGISSAANSIWQFEIVQLPSRRPENKGHYQLEIVDINFTGKTATDGIAKFFSSGIDCPFIESQFTFDIPAAMKNMIIAERTEMKGKVDISPEGNLPIDIGTLFSRKPDPVIEIITVFKQSLVEEDSKVQNTPTPEPEDPNNDATAAASAEDTEKEARKQNYELFMQQATVIPTIKDRNLNRDAAKVEFSNFFKLVKDSIANFFGFGSGGTETTTKTTLEQILAVGAWKDATLFRTLDLNLKNDTTPNNILLEIVFDFKIHGVSGIKTGDLFEIEDLPSQYKGKTAFTVTSISHTLDNGLWTTSVTGNMKLK